MSDPNETQCIICGITAPAASSESTVGCFCPRKHFVCRDDFNRYMSHNVLPQLYKLKFNRCEILCPDGDCKEHYNLRSLLRILNKDESTRLLQIAQTVAGDDESPIFKYKGDILDSLSLKCPHCEAAVDPSPDACCAVSCLNCGYFYCHCCFEPFGKGEADRESKQAHEHCATHDTTRPPEQRSAFLPAETVSSGHRTAKKARFEAVVKKLRDNSGLDRRDLELAIFLCDCELNDAGIEPDATDNEEKEAAVDNAAVTTSSDSTAIGEVLSLVSVIAEMDPSMLQEAMNSAEMQNLLSSPEQMADIISSDPQTHAVLDANPHLRQTLNDPAARKNLFDIMSNPATLQGLARHMLSQNKEEDNHAQSQLFQLANAFHQGNHVASGQLVSILGDKLDPNYVCTHCGETLLILALLSEDRAAVSALLSAGRGANPLCLVHSGSLREQRSAMYIAIEKGYLDELRLMVPLCDSAKDTKVSFNDSFELTMLHVAVQYGQVDVISYLLDEVGVDPNTQAGLNPITPVMLAVQMGREDLVALLFSHNASLQCRSMEGRLPLYLAIEKGHVNCIKYLVTTCGVDINDELTLEISKCHAVWLAIHNNKSYLLSLLISLGADLNASDSEFGLSPLHYASLKGMDDAVELLLLAGADPFKRTAIGRSAVWIACEFGHAGVVRLLVEKSKNGVALLLNSPCAASGDYPIHVAASFNKPQIVASLLNMGADATVLTRAGLSALQLAMKDHRNATDLIALLSSAAERKEFLNKVMEKKA